MTTFLEQISGGIRHATLTALGISNHEGVAQSELLSVGTPLLSPRITL
jgi:hypothetical protein